MHGTVFFCFIESIVTGHEFSSRTPAYMQCSGVKGKYQLLASQVTNILLLPGFWWSITVRHSLSRTLMAQMPLGACSSSQPGNHFCDFFVVNSKHNLMLLVSLGRNINMYALTMPRKVHTSVAVFGTGHFKIMSTSSLQNVATKEIYFQLNEFTFFGSQYNLVACKANRTIHKCFACSCTSFDQITMLSI